MEGGVGEDGEDVFEEDARRGEVGELAKSGAKFYLKTGEFGGAGGMGGGLSGDLGGGGGIGRGSRLGHGGKEIRKEEEIRGRSRRRRRKVEEDSRGFFLVGGEKLRKLISAKSTTGILRRYTVVTGSWFLVRGYWLLDLLVTGYIWVDIADEKSQLDLHLPSHCCSALSSRRTRSPSYRSQKSLESRSVHLQRSPAVAIACPAGGYRSAVGPGLWQ